MPAVRTYWQLPEDERDFLAFLMATGTIVGMPDHWTRTKEELAPQPIVTYIERDDPQQFLFGLEEYAREAVIEPKSRDGEQFFSVGFMSAHLIGYRRGSIRDRNKLGQSNLAAYWEYLSEDNTELIPKDPGFIRWAKKVFAWVRRATPERLECNGYPYPATRRVKDAVEQGQIEVVLY